MAIQKNSIKALILIFGTPIVSAIISILILKMGLIDKYGGVLIFLVITVITHIPHFVGYGMLITQIKKQKREPLDYVYIVFATSTLIVMCILDLLLILLIFIIIYINARVDKELLAKTLKRQHLKKDK